MDNKFIVIRKRSFYAGTLGDDRARPITDSSGDTIVFDSLNEARTWIDEEGAEVYYLAHGEAGRPEYWIVPADEDDWLAAIGRDDSLIDWDNCSCIEADGDPCGDCEKCYEYMNAKIEEHLRRAEINEEEAHQ